MAFADLVSSWIAPWGGECTGGAWFGKPESLPDGGTAGGSCGALTRKTRGGGGAPPPSPRRAGGALVPADFIARRELGHGALEHRSEAPDPPPPLGRNR